MVPPSGRARTRANALHPGPPRRVALSHDPSGLVPQLERLLREQSRASARAEALLRITSQLSSALGLREVIDVVIDGYAVVGGYGGGVGLYSQDGQMNVLALRNYGGDIAERRVGVRDPDLDVPLMNAARTGKLEHWHDRRTLDERYPHLVGDFGAQTQALAALPLVLGEQVIGGLVIIFSTPQDFNDDSLEFMQTVAGLCAQALERGRIFAREQDTALTLQRSLLPPLHLDSPDLDAAARYLPGAAGAKVGGDWYDVVHLGSDRTALVVGDVMGRGVRAAALMGQVRSAVRSYARLDLPPAEIMVLLDALVSDIAAETGDDAIVTCLYAVHDPAEHHLVVSSAGHPQPAFTAPGAAARLLPVPPGPVLGMGDGVYTETVHPFPAGAVLALYTDGLVEERHRHVTTGQAELLQTLLQSDGPLDELADAILLELGHLQDSPTSDDVALLLLRSRADAAPPLAYTALDGAEPNTARVLVRAELSGLPDDVVNDAELLASEIVTNAIMHGRRPVEFRVRRKVNAVLLEVRDLSTVLPRRRTADADAEGGRGLNLVAQLAHRWGWRNDGAGKVVWAELRP